MVFSNYYHTCHSGFSDARKRGLAMQGTSGACSPLSCVGKDRNPRVTTKPTGNPMDSGLFRVGDFHEICDSEYVQFLDAT